MTDRPLTTPAFGVILGPTEEALEIALARAKHAEAGPAKVVLEKANRILGRIGR